MSKADRLDTPPDYLKTFSLKCEPFANDLDGRFFYGGTALMQRLDLLTHLTQFGDSVVLVAGPPGSGKTTLLGRFAAQASKQWRLCLINASEFEQFHQRLADTLRIGESDDALQMLAQWVAQTDNSQLLVVVIDNAEELPESTFETLCTLVNQEFSERIRLILFGTPEAQQTLKRSLDQKNLKCTTQLLEVPRLSEEETASYLMYRLAVAGYSGESPFTATEVRGICKAADGRPAEINRLAHDSLFEHSARARSKRPQPRQAGRKRGVLVWAPASLLVIAVALYLGWERLQPTLPDGDVADQAAAPGDSLPLEMPAPATTKTPAEPAPAAAPSETVIDTAPAAVARTTETGPPHSAIRAPAVTPPTAPAEPASTTAAADSPEPVAAAVDVPAGETPAPAAEADIPATPQPQTPAQATPSGGTAAKSAAAEQAPAPRVPETPAPAAVAPDSPVSAVAPATTPPAPAGSDVATGSVAPAGPHREDWLLQQDENRFSLQLLGSRNEKSVQEYIRQHKLNPEQVAYYRGSYRGGEWYVLMHGVYPDKPAALAARDGLPAKVRAAKPWPRSFRSVHQAIREVR